MCTINGMTFRAPLRRCSTINRSSDCIEFRVARIQTKFCRSCLHHRKGRGGLGYWLIIRVRAQYSASDGRTELLILLFMWHRTLTFTERQGTVFVCVSLCDATLSSNVKSNLFACRASVRPFRPIISIVRWRCR